MFEVGKFYQLFLYNEFHGIQWKCVFVSDKGTPVLEDPDSGFLTIPQDPKNYKKVR